MIIEFSGKEAERNVSGTPGVESSGEHPTQAFPSKFYLYPVQNPTV